MKQQEADDRKSTAASYIYSFYQNIQSLNDFYSQYLCIMMDFKNTYKMDDSGQIKANDEAKEQIKQQIQNVRYILNKVYIQYKTIIKSLELKDNPKLSKLYEEVKSEYMIKAEILEEIVIEMNRVLVDNIIQDLLHTSQDLMQSAVS